MNNLKISPKNDKKDNENKNKQELRETLARLARILIEVAPTFLPFPQK